MYLFPKIFAHRGASAYAPENTLIAMQIAKEKGAVAVECDVVLTTDGYPIIFHDRLVDRTTKGKGPIAQMTLAQVKELDAGSWFHARFANEPVPTLEALLKQCAKLGLWINLEIKPTVGKEEETVNKILDCVSLHGPGNKPPILYSSFCEITLICLRKRLRNAFIGMLYENWEDIDFERVKFLNPLSVHLEKSVFTKERVAYMEQQGYLSFAYTVNEASEWKRLEKMGVSSFFTDYPDLLI